MFSSQETEAGGFGLFLVDEASVDLQGIVTHFSGMGGMMGVESSCGCCCQQALDCFGVLFNSFEAMTRFVKIWVPSPFLL